MRRCDILKNRGYLAMKFGKTQSISKAYQHTICLPVQRGRGFHIVGGSVISRASASGSSSGRSAPYNSWKYSSR